MARLFGSRAPIQAGEFEIPKGMGGAAVLELLQHGKPLLRLITVTEGMPSVRLVLLKLLDERGFTFFTNFDSRKGREMAANPRVALVFPWHAL